MKLPSPPAGHAASPPVPFRIDRGGLFPRGVVPAAKEATLAGFPIPNNSPDATSATLLNGGGPVLQHVQVFLVLWGSAWNNNPDPTPESIANAATRILYGPYMSGLAQYGVGGGSLIGWKVIPSPDPLDPFSDSDVQAFVLKELGAGTLPVPTQDNQILFAVIMPRLLLGSDTSLIGEHKFVTFKGLKVPCAWVMNNGLDFVTVVFSHELIEACSDPNVNRTIVQGGPGSACPNTDGNNCEIGDVCSSTDLVVGVRVQSYWSAKDNACVVPRNIVSAEVASNPVLIKGRFLNPGNFEMLSPLASGGLAHFSRVNSVDFVPWFGPEVFGTNVGHFDAISMIQSNFTTGSGVGNLEVVALFRSSLLYYWREDVPPYIWHGPVPMNGFQQRLFTGNPVLIQGRFLKRGNFELVVPLASGGIAHYSRVNDDPALPWFGPEVFGTDVGQFDAITMIQSKWTIGPKVGLLEVVARVGGTLVFYFREDAPPYKWWGPLPANGFNQSNVLFAGNPVLIEGRFGNNADNFELVVPLDSGGLAHYWRNNDSSSRTWSGPTVFAQDVGRFEEISFIQSSFSSGAGIGNLELVARVGRSLFAYWRDDTSPFTWYGPRVVSW
jgi:hypothetical protein